MSKIAELREIDGAMWARVPMDGTEGCIQLLSDAEIEADQKKWMEVFADNERLRAALKHVIDDIHEYERINNLAPNPGRTECWDSVAYALRVLDGTSSEQTPSNEAGRDEIRHATDDLSN